MQYTIAEFSGQADFNHGADNSLNTDPAICKAGGLDADANSAIGRLHRGESTCERHSNQRHLAEFPSRIHTRLLVAIAKIRLGT